MSSPHSKSSAESCCLKDKANGFWDAKLNGTDIKEHGFALLVLAMCLYNISKLIIVTTFWRKGKALLLCWLTGTHVDRRTDSLTSDLRTEMRELSEEISQFQKWSKVQMQEPNQPILNTTMTFCKKCKQKKVPIGEPSIYKTNGYMPRHIDKEISECNWLQYLHEYVYNPSPRILDTNELGNMKRAYSNWFQ